MASEKESPPASSTDFSSYGVYDEKEQTVNYVSYNKTQIMDKLVEPENNIDQRELNRNLQLGNIDRVDVQILEQKWTVAKLLEFIPIEQGKFLFSSMGALLKNQINFKTIVTNSVDGVGRKAGMTQIRKDEFKDTTQRGALDSIFNRSKGNQR